MHFSSTLKLKLKLEFILKQMELKVVMYIHVYDEMIEFVIKILKFAIPWEIMFYNISYFIF